MLIGLLIDAGLLLAIIWILSGDSSVKEEFFKLFLVAAGTALLGLLMVHNMEPLPAFAAYFGLLVLGLHFVIKVRLVGALIASTIFIAVKIAIRMLFATIM